MTENLQTPLLVTSLALLAGGAPRRGQLLTAGLLAGLASLARSVSIGLVPAAAVGRIGGEVPPPIGAHRRENHFHERYDFVRPLG